ncbi:MULTISPECIES: blue-light-activated histidine kinase [unclassified Rhizobium]|uniref:blue-light-activated histidine kinase n=1 Tax=unclassified Rhizobium TaxID=2613769 RepID=UPI001ADBFF79|nr:MULTISPECIES: PAS domain-containing protein [unclassified Rhizobium]MBO9100775.1 PAS domain-containing protein [Rhizobium sp. L58/93]MBO9186361.1 PAS domain-containing protein [Rhizobium sp. E27B/91]QXZ87255.1 PAS domain-containing protein [Rhizobium sp. K1/93]QXZ92712.1 PAS domain-containing protein [Rhizobium sp. K15/93]QYA04069.1 PAS domain-containing protein [Rhizobium sp. B21/90]
MTNDEKPAGDINVSSLSALSPSADQKELYTIAFERSRTPMVMADAGQGQNPILFANKAFLELTGYALSEVVGRDCRFLQGPATSKSVTSTIGASIRSGVEVAANLLNYRKDGSEFWNELHISPIRNDEGEIAYFFASQMDVTELRRVAGLEASERRLLREVDHRAKNVLAVVNSIVRLSKATDPSRYASAVRDRIQTLADVHTLLAEKGWDSISLEEIVRQQFTAFGPHAVQLEGPGIGVEATDAQPLALVLHELVANATSHGALANEAGNVEVHWRKVEPGGLEIDWRERGPVVPAATRAAGFGTALIDALVEKQLRGSISRDWRTEGLSLVIRLPSERPLGTAPIVG